MADPPHVAASLVLAVALAGCGGGSGDESGESAPAATGIAGLWDITVRGDGYEDVAYLEIGEDNSVTAYDYYGDSFDRGGNCYVIFRTDQRFVPLGDDRYTVSGAEDAGEIRIVREGDELVTTHVDELDGDGDGDVTETIVERFPAVVGLSSTDFDECLFDDGSDAGSFDDGRPAKRRLVRWVGRS